MSRCHLLQTCGASFLAIVHIVCTRMQEVKGPIGSMSQKMASFFTCALPCIYGFQIQWLSVLSLLDDWILTSERIAEIAFPPSAHVFDKIDKLACAAEGLPIKFEAALNKFPMIMHQVPFLDWALVHLIAWLNFLISAISHWGSKTTREKEITVDMSFNNYNDSNAESEPTDKAYFQTDQPPPKHASSEDVYLSPMFDSAPESTNYASLVVPFLALQCTETEDKSFLISSPESSSLGGTETDNTYISCTNDSPPIMTDSAGSGKCSYKEILTKGVKEEAEMEDNMSVEPTVPLQISKDNGEIPIEEDAELKKHEDKGVEIPSEKIVNEKKKRKAEKDQILRLFDASWSLS